MNIGLLGCLINNENLGCQALTFSILSLLEDINKSNKNLNSFNYYVFETNPDNEKTKQVALLLNIDSSRIMSFNITPMFRLRRFIHHFSIGKKTFSVMKKCDIFIDMTGGDSFTDIYGQYTFDGETNVKYLVKKLGKKLILGPQTYGPFRLEKNFEKAIRLINQADLIISRDQQSKDYISQYIKNECHVTTDVAFMLPYKIKGKIHRDKIVVGINISGLLLPDKIESTELTTKLKANYDKYVIELINYLLEKGQYEVHIIPHVGNEGIEWTRKQFGDKLIYHKQYENPMDAKADISEMDIFIGSRMHATISAFSTGVATIPIAYSRKFSGLFENMRYPYVVDLTKFDTDRCLLMTKGLIEDYNKLRIHTLNSRMIWEKFYKLNKELILSVFDVC